VKSRIELAAPFDDSYREGEVNSDPMEVGSVVAIPLSNDHTKSDVESQSVVPVAVSVAILPPTASMEATTDTTTIGGDDDVEERSENVTSITTTKIGKSSDGKKIGYAMITITTIGLVTGFVPSFSWITMYLCTILTLVLTSIVSCTCCCASKYQMRPRTKGYIIAALCFTILHILFYLIITIGIILKSGDSRFEYFTEVAIGIISIALEISTLLLVCLYTFQR
jgi:hypothetical protein